MILSWFAYRQKISIKRLQHFILFYFLYRHHHHHCLASSLKSCKKKISLFCLIISFFITKLLIEIREKKNSWWNYLPYISLLYLFMHNYNHQCFNEITLLLVFFRTIFVNFCVWHYWLWFPKRNKSSTINTF